MIKLSFRKIVGFKRRPLIKEEIHFVKSLYANRGCAYCDFMVAHVNWWCSNKEAIKARHSAIPEVIHCPYWKPDKEYIRKEMKSLKV